MQRFYIVYRFYILGISEMKIVKVLLLPFLFSAFEDFIISIHDNVEPTYIFRTLKKLHDI